VPTTAGNVINGSIPALKFVNAAAYDYHLLRGSPAINAAVAPGVSSDGYSLTPSQEYVRENGVKPRHAGMPRDAGAYDFPFVGGDANHDGKVDVVDLGILSTNYDTVTGATWAMGDFDADGKVDVVDLGILSMNYDYVAAGGSAPAAASSPTGGVSALSAPTQSAVLLAAAPAPVATATVEVASAQDSAAAIGTIKGKKAVRVGRLQVYAARPHLYSLTPPSATAGSL
jgi:hypothetical protein